MSSDEIEELLNLAEENLNEARILFENKMYKGAVSRAYYSMFHAAQALLLTKDITPKKHVGVLKTIGMEFVNKGLLDKTYSKYYKYAFDIRHKVDYEAKFKVSEELADELIEDAEEFLEKIKEILDNI
jgi:uncharacterized protein (UPF0332 family)